MADDFGITGEAQIPYFIHEGDMARMERVNKRWFVAFLIVLIMLFATNAGWIFYESQFSTETITKTTYEAESDSGNAVLNGSGEVNIYGGEGEGH